MIYKGMNCSLYSDNLRDFINKEVKITKSKTHYFFESKVEKYVLAKIQYTFPSVLPDIYLFYMLDSIFYTILNQKADETI